MSLTKQVFGVRYFHLHDVRYDGVDADPAHDAREEHVLQVVGVTRVSVDVGEEDPAQPAAVTDRVLLLSLVIISSKRGENLFKQRLCHFSQNISRLV